MKNAITAAAILIVAGFVVLSAATPSQTMMRANIPFAFLAGEQMYPAGDYWVGVNNDFRYVNLRSVDSTTEQRVAFNGTCVQRNGQDLAKGFLQFERYGATYTLHAVGVPDAKAGVGLKPSSAEKELARANGGSASAEVTLIP